MCYSFGRWIGRGLVNTLAHAVYSCGTHLIIVRPKTYPADSKAPPFFAPVPTSLLLVHLTLVDLAVVNKAMLENSNNIVRKEAIWEELEDSDRLLPLIWPPLHVSLWETETAE